MVGHRKYPLQRWSLPILAAFLAVPLAIAPARAADVLTPVLAQPLIPSAHVVAGTDGARHLVYELELTNATRAPATLRRLEVVAADHPDVVLARFDGAALVAHLRRPGAGVAPVTAPTWESSGSRVFLADFTLPASGAAPSGLLHRFEVEANVKGDAQTYTYTGAPMQVTTAIDVLGPPLSGRHWVVVNGCCAPGGAHRSTGLPINDHLDYAQRFAIDWVQLDPDARFFKGDGTRMEDYAYYGAKVLAVADGTVVSIMDDMDNQEPGHMPDPATIGIHNITGNHVVLDLGKGRYGLYAHLQKGSLRVAVGDRVRRGQVLALLGNTGNTSAPHLHFHLMDSPSPLASSGLPYVFEHLQVAGQLSAQQFDQGALDGDWKAGLFDRPRPHAGEFPLDLTVVDFPD